ncbi:MAG: HAD family phosphatase [Eggerthellaceae bacterium]|nr:HAD family phosphatase [Eggerthellaceae bacterium]
MTLGAIFDCDGVLLDSAHAWRDAEAELSRRADATLTVDDKRALATMTIAEVGDFFHRQFSLGCSGEDVVGMIEQIMGDFYAHCVQPIAGIGAFLERLAAAGMKMSVVSSTQTDFLRIGLKHVGLLDYFCSVLSVEDLNTNKREPLIYRQAMQDMGSVPATTWGFDDSYYAIQTMNALGIHTVGVYDAENPYELDLLRRHSDILTCDYSTLDIKRIASSYAL